MPSSKYFSRAVPLLLLPLAACGGDAPRGFDLPPATVSGWRGQVEAVGDAQGVRNPDTPLLPDGSVRVDAAWRLADQAGWTRPTALAVSNEAVFVLDAAAGRIHVATHAGQPQGDLGEGAGLSEPVSIAWSGGTLAVGDPGRGGIVMMRDDGLPMEPVRGLERAAVAGLASGGFVANPFGGRSHQWAVYGARGGERMVELPPPPSGSADGYCAAVSGGRWILQADCASPAFNVLDDQGKLVRRIGIDRVVAPAPGPSDSLAAALQRQLQAGGAQPADSAVRRLLETPGPAGVTRGARHDPASRLFALWGQLPGGGAWVDLFSEEGVYLATVRFERPWRDVGFARSTLFALEEGEDGKAALAAYRLRLPSNAAKAARDAARPRTTG